METAWPELDFDAILAVPVREIFFDGDTPRARRHDPLESQMAADRSAKTRQQVRDNVLALFDIHPTLTGNECNLHYSLISEFVQGHQDSPRKRLGELHDDGLVEVVGRRNGERVFARKDKP